MHLVIDANIIAGYFKVAVIGKQHGLTASPVPIVTELGKSLFVYLDEKKQIEKEWRSNVEREWFDAWYGDLLISGAAIELPVDTCHHLKKCLISQGFPVSKDMWYVRIAMSTLASKGSVDLLSEDVDFYDPKAKCKGHKVRMQLLTCGKGPVAKILRKEKINVSCIATYCAKFT